MNRNLALLLLGLLSAACQPATEPATPGYEYAPLETGRFWIYEVAEQQFLLNGPPISRTYQVRETITNAYKDLTGATAYRFERARRVSDNQSWQPDSAASVRISNDLLIRSENNLDYVRLAFPVSERAEWNGNLYNSLGRDDYQIRNTNRPVVVLNQTFPQTITVVQQNDSTLVNQDKRLEVYAREVGLIYRERVQLQFCSSTPSCVGKGQIDFGIRQYMRLKSYGKQ